MSHILIAYEREAEQAALEKLLLTHGHSVIRAANGLEALDVARREAPEAVVSDVLLPRMDGVALCRKWKQDERLQGVPFLFYTQRYDDPKYERFALELGAEKFLPRTTKPEAVLQAIEAVLANAAPRVPVLEEPAPEAVSAMTRSQALVREQQLRTQLAELEATAKRHAAGEAQFRGLFEDNPLPLLIVDQATGGFIAVNAAALEFYGYQRSEFLGLQRSSLAAAQSRESDQDVAWHVRKDGRRLPVVLAATQIQFAGRAAELLCVQDSATSWQHTQNIQAQLKLQRNLLDALPGGWCLVDREGHLLDANEVYCRMSGYERDELLRKKLKDLETESSSSDGYESQHRRRDGSLYPVDVRVTALRDAAGTETGARILLIQEPSARALAAITAQHRAQREAAELAQLNAALLEEHEVHGKGSAQRIAQLALELARELGLTPTQCERVRLAGLLHDVGLMTIPASLLHKPVEFSAAETALVRTHAEAGARLLSRLPDTRIAEIVHQHHERVNGSGYPRGLSGEAILIEARVLAVADVVEAMCSPRAHRPALGMQAALQEIENNAGVLYDGKVVTACLRLLREQQFAFAA